ncbi:DNA polymerase/3'-5' exonuclease PolX [Candidatus Daviesbacteria bacterium]|nr:DNA polymerase/3'-5' exonuclease PolX [Candidatus Daviesbacteria bacterium]
MEYTNAQIAKLLRSVAAAYTLKKIGNIFQIRAYENAADSVEHSTSNIKDLWQEGQLDQIPGIGDKIKEYLDELFKKGKVEHFVSVKKGIPEVVFELLGIPGIGPKTAAKIADLGVKDLRDLKENLKDGKLVKKGLSEKLAQTLLLGLEESGKRDNRMLLPYAFAQAERILKYLKLSPDVEKADFLGSLRRMVATVGDLDFAASSRHPAEVMTHFIKMPQIKRVLDQGDNKASVVLDSNLQVDLLVGHPQSYGALLQHFTGSKSHNIHLRTVAEKKGLSLSEYGVTKVKSKKSKVKEEEVIKTETEEELYGMMGMQTPAPEIREDTGEIEAALKHKLPSLIKLEDIKGDLHTHSNYPFEHPSHGLGIDSMENMISKAKQLGYEFIGISDHPPGFSAVSSEAMVKSIEKRTKVIQNIKQNTKSIRVLNGLEIDILADGQLSVPDEALKTLDYCIAGIHSGHRGSKEIITKRILAALENPHVDVLSHPTNRLINERESSDADWDEIFKFCAKNKKLLEINGYPNRLDLRDDLVKPALKYGVKFIINTDAHAKDQMNNMRFGVAVARRGWATKEDIVNSWDWTKLANWFNI